MGCTFGRLRAPVAALMIGALGGCATTGLPTDAVLPDSNRVTVHAPTVRLGSNGKFAFDYDGGAEATATFRTFIDDSRLPSDTRRDEFVQQLRAAVDGFDRAAEIELTNTSTGATATVSLRFALDVVDDPDDAHKRTVVFPGTHAVSGGPFKRIADVTANRVRLPIEPGMCGPFVYAHEIGHVFGLPDEYRYEGLMGFFQNIVNGQTENTDDLYALMHHSCGRGLRDRYFAPFGELLQDAHAARGDHVTFQVRLIESLHN